MDSKLHSVTMKVDTMKFTGGGRSAASDAQDAAAFYGKVEDDPGAESTNVNSRVAAGEAGKKKCEQEADGGREVEGDERIDAEEKNRVKGGEEEEDEVVKAVVGMRTKRRRPLLATSRLKVTQTFIETLPEISTSSQQLLHCHRMTRLGLVIFQNLFEII